MVYCERRAHVWRLHARLHGKLHDRVLGHAVPMLIGPMATATAVLMAL